MKIKPTAVVNPVFNKTTPVIMLRQKDSLIVSAFIQRKENFRFARGQSLEVPTHQGRSEANFMFWQTKILKIVFGWG